MSTCACFLFISKLLLLQTQLYRLTEHLLKKENLLSIRRTAATELAVADAINIEKAIADKSSSKVVYLNLCSQEILHHSESKAMENNAVEPNSSSPLGDNGSERISDKDSDDPAVLEALRAAGLADSPPNSPTRSTEVPRDSSLDKAREVGPDNVLDIDSIPDTDIYGDFEYDLDDEVHIGATKATKASETQPEEGLTKVKVVFSTVQPEKVINQSEVFGNEETTANQKGTTNGEEDEKSFVPMEPVPEAEGEGEGEGEGEVEGEGEGGEILSVAECEELYGPGTEKLVEKPLAEGLAESGPRAKVPDSECESNTHREIIASNFENSSIKEKKPVKRIQKCNPSEKPPKEEKNNADGLGNSITRKVIKTILMSDFRFPFCLQRELNWFFLIVLRWKHTSKNISDHYAKVE